MRTTPLATGEFYHLYNRGVEKRNTFVTDYDFARFLQLFYEKSQGSVTFVAYALMPNHYHFLVRQEVEGGISLLMQRALGSYTKYFNQRVARDGRLWTTPFKAKRIDSDAYLQTIITYIHGNPLDLNTQNKVAEEFLREYPWSSYRHYSGITKDPLLSLPLPELFNTRVQAQA